MKFFIILVCLLLCGCSRLEIKRCEQLKEENEKLKRQVNYLVRFVDYIAKITKPEANLIDKLEDAFKGAK